MKINQIIINESSCGASTSGAVATIAKPLGEVQKRVPVQKTAKKKGPYANSLSESKMKDLDYDLKNMKPTEFQKKYGKKREEMIASFKQQPQQKSQQVPVKEADLHEEDKIIAVGKGHKLKPGLLNKPENSLNPTDTVKLDVPFLIRLLEYAREDANTDMDLHDLAEKLVDRGRRGKTLTMKDYEFVVDEAMSGGVVASGMPGESVQEGEYDIRKDPTYQKYNPETHTMMYKDSKHKAVKHDQVAKAKELGWKVRSSLKAFTKGQGGVAEGAKVDRMVQHIKKSEIEAGKSKDKAEDIAWATVNKRGYLDNKNKKKKAK